jgi:hypothetical protein
MGLYIGVVISGLLVPEVSPTPQPPGTITQLQISQHSRMQEATKIKKRNNNHRIQ